MGKKSKGESVTSPFKKKRKKKKEFLRARSRSGGEKKRTGLNVMERGGGRGGHFLLLYTGGENLRKN